MQLGSWRTGLRWVGLTIAAASAFLMPRVSPPMSAYAGDTSGQTLRQVGVIDLPGPPGRRFDYLAIDYDDDYLFINHLAAGVLYVVDLKTNTVVKTIDDVPGGEGVEYVPELKRLYTSNAGDNTIGVIDLRQMRVVKKLPTEAKPDGSTYAGPYPETPSSPQDTRIQQLEDEVRELKAELEEIKKLLKDKKR